MKNAIKQKLFHENSKNDKFPSKADLINRILDACDNIDSDMLKKVAKKCYRNLWSA